MIWLIPVMLVGSYLIGGIPFGFILSKASRGIDIREHGSRNIGATNVMRVLGKGLGATVFFLDVLKGFIPAFLGLRFLDPYCGIAGGVGALSGHIFPPYLKFRGGKGVATGLGVFLGLAPVAVGMCFGIWAIALLLSKYVSLASIIAALSLPLVLLLERSLGWGEYSLGVMVVALVAALAVLLRHIPNVKRLMRGEESKFKMGRG